MERVNLTPFYEQADHDNLDYILDSLDHQFVMDRMTMLQRQKGDLCWGSMMKSIMTLREKERDLKCED